MSHARKLQVLYSENRTAFSLLVNEMIMVRDEFQEAAALIIGSHTEVKIIAYWHRTYVVVQSYVFLRQQLLSGPEISTAPCGFT